MLKNKHGWLLIVEVAIAIVIMFSFLFVVIQKQPKSQKLDMDSELDYIVEQCTKNEIIRSLMLSDINSAESMLRTKINPRLNLSFTAPTVNKDIYSTTFVLWNNQTGESEKFVAYVWLED
ncbi:MAG: hypothetical protein QXP53_02700 [Candidatus Pacearchaeota archaeon]